MENLTTGIGKVSINDGYAGNGMGHYGIPNGVGTVAGEHPYGEHPSRTLFVRNINSNVEDSELRALFEHYGDIRTLYTACKHRGFVMISYYDIRAARTAMRALQNKPLRRRKLDIHFSIPKDNPSDKDMNQGTLVVFNLDPSVSNDDLRQIFGAYGEVKEIRETPHKRHHKFIEFYDQLTQELEQDNIRGYRHVGSPLANSPPGVWAQFGSPTDNHLQTISKSPTAGAIGSMGSNHLPGLASVLPPLIANTVKIAPIGKDQSRINHTDQVALGLGHQVDPSFSGVVQLLIQSNLNLLAGHRRHHLQGLSFTPNGQIQGKASFIQTIMDLFLPSSNPHHQHVGSAPSGSIGIEGFLDRGRRIFQISTHQRCCWQQLMRIIRVLMIFYLPIDFKNKCNVGYAFINMLSPSHIISFYQAFNGKKWEKFNSEKVASLAYAINSGQISTYGPEAGDQEPFPPNGMDIPLRQQEDDLSGDRPETLKDDFNEKLESNGIPGNGLERYEVEGGKIE
ncbi:hypothetical protein J5N97_027739 [Dioscorea zingiberensis]|uniref:RRM domain-containing protein n=1 Tax=Dioscorea zingiberensis TaxID=325984 RepID=A0A9D5BX86_9LILI|nr:hypothetical protein J5N97_027739 [Dioscorea zingiberensis]